MPPKPSQAQSRNRQAALDAERMTLHRPLDRPHPGDTAIAPSPSAPTSSTPRPASASCAPSTPSAKENDPSSHAEVPHRPPRLQETKRASLKGYTMYTTCEPCPMCMANALWAGLDRVVYGATIADANRFCGQISSPPPRSPPAPTCTPKSPAPSKTNFALHSLHTPTCSAPSRPGEPNASPGQVAARAAALESQQVTQPIPNAPSKQ